MEAAKLAWKIGFDFVDLKQCHTYLLSELLAAKTREGRYGGSFENRTRFIRNIVGKIRAEVGDGLILATRLNVYDGVAYMEDPETTVGIPRDIPTPYLYGFGVDENNPPQPDMTEPIKLVGVLKELGVKLVNVTTGSPYFNPHIGRRLNAHRSMVTKPRAPTHRRRSAYPTDRRNSACLSRFTGCWHRLQLVAAISHQRRRGECSGWACKFRCGGTRCIGISRLREGYD